MPAEAWRLDGRAHDRSILTGRCRVCGAAAGQEHMPTPVRMPTPEAAPTSPQNLEVTYTSQLVTILMADGTVEGHEAHPDFDGTKVMGLGRYRGGAKHGVRRQAPDFQDVPHGWRVTLYEFHYEEGTVLVQKLEAGFHG